ncbi:MAG: hypothetical protein NWF01_09750 [Candidatus Bathyarchaeota archaeon]|nr:hypothetical protein [Candidatus Bathyarchaeota archaeon]
MPKKAAPPPSRAAQRLKEYLDIIKTAEDQKGKALWYDIYRRAGNQYQTEQVIAFLAENGLISGNKEVGYVMTKKGHM